MKSPNIVRSGDFEWHAYIQRNSRANSDINRIP
jgi:hypothetical protein